MPNSNKDWINVEWIANVPVEHLEKVLKQADAAVSQRFNYLLLDDGSVRRAAPPQARRTGRDPRATQERKSDR